MMERQRERRGGKIVNMIMRRRRMEHQDEKMPRKSKLKEKRKTTK